MFFHHSFCVVLSRHEYILHIIRRHNHNKNNDAKERQPSQCQQYKVAEAQIVYYCETTMTMTKQDGIFTKYNNK